MVVGESGGGGECGGLGEWWRGREKEKDPKSR